MGAYMAKQEATEQHAGSIRAHSETMSESVQDKPSECLCEATHYEGAAAKREGKARMRAFWKQRRIDIDGRERAEMDAAIAKAVIASPYYRDCPVLCAYASFGVEVSTRTIIEDAWSRGKTVVLPRCGAEGQLRWFIIGSFDGLEQSAMGMKEPPIDESREITAFEAEAVVLVPGLTFDLEGHRLGYGGGYYDRFLEHFPGISMGLCRSVQVSSTIDPREEHDRAVDVVITDKHTYDIHAPLTALSCREFCEALASHDPIPGGGGITAMVGALAASLCSMVVNFTAGRKKYAAYEEDLSRIIAAADTACDHLLELVQLDAHVFEPLSSAYAIPKDDPLRPEALDHEMKAACEPSLMMMEEIAHVIDLYEELIDKCTRQMLSDVGIGALFARASLQAASYVVYADAKLVRDHDWAQAAEQRCDQLTMTYAPRAEALAARVLSIIREPSLVE